MHQLKHKFRSRRSRASARPHLDVDSIERDLLAELERGGDRGDRLVDRLLRAIEGEPGAGNRKRLR